MNRYDQLMGNTLLTRLRVSQFIVAIVIYMSLLLMPNPQLGGDEMKNIVLHAIGNMLLMLSTWVASGGRMKAIGPLIFVIPFSLLVEMAQGLTSNRTPEMIDVVANFGGVMIGFVICDLLNSQIVERLKKGQATIA